MSGSDDSCVAPGDDPATRARRADRMDGRLGGSGLDYSRTASAAALAAAVGGLLYSVSFVIVARAAPALGAGLSAAFLLLGGVIGTAVLVGLHQRLREAGGPYATLALVLGVAGAMAAAAHGGYDLADTLPRD